MSALSSEETTEAETSLPDGAMLHYRVSVRAREGAEVKPQPEVCGSWPHAKLHAHFHSPTLGREVKLPLLGSPLVPFPPALSQSWQGMNGGAPDVSPARGTLRNDPCHGAQGMPTGVCPQIPGDPVPRGSQDGSQPLPPQQHTWRASHIHCPAPGLGREDGSGPGMRCQVTVLSTTSPTQTAVWICPLITPQKGGAGTVWWWVVDTHCPQVQGEEKHGRDVHARADLSQPSSPLGHSAEGSASALLGTPRAWSWARASVQCPEKSLEVAGQAETQLCGQVTRSCHCG